jgi:uncharacterized protein with FMN-binding domain
MEGQEKKNNGVIIGTVAALVIAVAAYGFYSYSKKGSESVAVNVVPTPTPSTEVVPTEAMKNFMYKDGSYTAVGNYNSPGGAEEIGVNVTVKGDVITDASVEVKATRPASKNWQTVVSKNIKSLVVGKKLNEVVLDKVSGSSLTPMGWNDAISKIKVQAQG